jgi:hypothetical protein
MKSFRLWASALILAFATVLTSCAETTAPQQQAPVELAAQDSAQLLELLSNTLKKTLFLTCSPMPRDTETQWVGPMGGTINVSKHKLVIPAGALDKWVKITAVAPSDTKNRVEFYPHGLEFDKPARLSMSYANCSLVGSLLPKHIAYTDDDFKVLELLDAVPSLLKRDTTAPIDHFSDYVVAW